MSPSISITGRTSTQWAHRRETAERWRKGEFDRLFVYQRGTWFIVSDDYIPLFAALTGLPDYVPCWVLGKPDSALLRDVQGPVDPEEVPRLLGIA